MQCEACEVLTMIRPYDGDFDDGSDDYDDNDINIITIIIPIDSL